MRNFRAGSRHPYPRREASDEASEEARRDDGEGDDDRGEADDGKRKRRVSFADTPEKDTSRCPDLKLDQVIMGVGCLVVAAGVFSAVFVWFFVDLSGDFELGPDDICHQCRVLPRRVPIPLHRTQPRQFPYYVDVLTDTARWPIGGSAHEGVAQAQVKAHWANHEPLCKDQDVALCNERFVPLIHKTFPCYALANSTTAGVVVLASDVRAVGYRWFTVAVLLTCVPCCFALGVYDVYAGVTGRSGNFMAQWRCDGPPGHERPGHSARELRGHSKKHEVEEV
jgi:hypothetical protein